MSSAKQKQEVQDMATERPKIQGRKLSDEVLSRLSDRISAGEFRPGEHLPSEREMMTPTAWAGPRFTEALQSLEHARVSSPSRMASGRASRCRPRTC